MLWAFISEAQDHWLRKYGVSDGLPQTRISCLAWDNRGYLWIGTRNAGVATFDKREFVSYSTLEGLQSNSIVSIVRGSNEAMWVIHPDGVSFFNGYSFRSFRNPELNGRNTGGFLYKDQLFIMTPNGLITCRDEKLVKAPLIFGNEITGAIRTQEGSDWIFLENGSVKILNDGIEVGEATVEARRAGVQSIFKRKGKNVISYREFDANHPDIPSNAIDFDKVHREFVVYEDSNLYMQPDSANEVRKLVMRDVIINQLLIDDGGTLWIATEGAGLVSIEHTAFSYIRFHGVSAITRDVDGDLFCGSYIDGLWKIHNRRAVLVSRINVRDLIVANSKLWVASDQGLGYVKDNTVQMVSKEIINSMDVSADGTLWCASDEGLLLRRDSTVQRISELDGRKIGPVSFVKSWPEAHVTLFGARQNFYALSTRDGKIRPLQIDGLYNSSIASVAILADTLLLLATQGAGMLVVDDQFRTVASFNKRNGLETNFISSVGVDDKQFVWMGSDKGISRISISPGGELVSINDFSLHDALFAPEAIADAIYLDQEISFGLVDGLVSIKEQPMIPCSNALHFTQIQNGDNNLSDALFSGVVEIPFEGNNLTINFNKVFCSEFADRRVSYRLLPVHKNWSHASVARQVNFQNLQPGEYSFEIKSLDAGASSNPVVLRIFVRPGFYQTAWFKVGIAFVLIISTIALFRWRLRRQAARVLREAKFRQSENEKLRKEIARDYHDETGNQLSLIIGYSSMLRVGVLKQGENNLASTIEEAARKLYYGTKDFIWSIDPENDEVNNLFIHIRDLGEKLFETDDHAHFRAANDIIGEVRLPLGTSRQISLIFREAINNTFKYARAANIFFGLKRTSNVVEFSLTDDGAGFDASAVRQSGGLANMKHRAAKIAATLHIESKVGAGTKIKLVYEVR